MIMLFVNEHTFRFLLFFFFLFVNLLINFLLLICIDVLLRFICLFVCLFLYRRGLYSLFVLGDPMSRAAEASALISAVRRGSVAHRSGTIQPGDRLLAVDGLPLDPADPVRDADRALGAIASAAGDVVTLTIRKDDAAAHQGSGTSSPG